MTRLTRRFPGTLGIGTSATAFMLWWTGAPSVLAAVGAVLRSPRLIAG
jgi:hypothetical protein